MNVIVVPEIEDYKLDVSHGEEIWINLKLGIPKLDEREAKYIAPFWITEDFIGVNRIYHILDAYEDATEFIIKLGNSFKLPQSWNNMGQNRRFEYHDLKTFGMIELQDGILIPI